MSYSTLYYSDRIVSSSHCIASNICVFCSCSKSQQGDWMSIALCFWTHVQQTQSLAADAAACPIPVLMGWVSVHCREFPAIPARGRHRGPGGMGRGLFGLQPPVAIWPCWHAAQCARVFQRADPPGGCEGGLLTHISVLRAEIALLFRPCFQAARGLVSRSLLL